MLINGEQHIWEHRLDAFGFFGDPFNYSSWTAKMGSPNAHPSWLESKTCSPYNLVEQFDRMVSKCEKSETTWLCPAQKNHSIPIHSCCLMPLRSIPCSLVECKLKSNPPKKGAGERQRVAERSCLSLPTKSKGYLDHQKSLRCFWISFQMILYGCFQK